MIILLCRNEKTIGYMPQTRAIRERFRPMPICLPILYPTPHALVTVTLIIPFPFSLYNYNIIHSCSNWITKYQFTPSIFDITMFYWKTSMEVVAF